MKTQFKALLLMISFIFMGAICSCDKHSSDKDDDEDTENVKLDERTVQKLIDKYHEDGWDKADYSKAIDIYEEFGYKASEKFESIIKKADSGDEVDNEYNKLMEKYSYIEDLWEILRDADVDEMGEKNYYRLRQIHENIDDKFDSLWDKVYNEYGRQEDKEYGYDSEYYEPEYPVQEVNQEVYEYEDVAVEKSDYEEYY